MHTENSLIDAALRGWKSNVERVGDLFGTLSPEQLEQQVTPGKNRLIYLWGHLTAVNDGSCRCLALANGFIRNSTQCSFRNQTIHRTHGDGSISQVGMGQDQPEALGRIFEVLAVGLAGRHTAVSEEEFKREPKRNKFTVLLGRTAHMSYHVGQAMLARPKA